MANSLQTSGLMQLKAILNNETMKRNFERVLKSGANSFMDSIITLYQSDTLLQKCDPNKIVLEAYKAATLDLSISKNFGYCYIIPYGSTPSFQMGYLGWIQLAQRSGMYEKINVDRVYEGMTVKSDYLTGDIEITGSPTSDNVIGYFAFFRLKNGFSKAIFWDKERVIAHAKKFSQAYRAGKKDSPWFTNFDAMAEKTVLLRLLKRFGPMSIAMQQAAENDVADRVEAEVAENANKSAVVIPAEEVEAQQKESVQADAETVETPFPMEGEPQYDPDEEPGF